MAMGPGLQMTSVQQNLQYVHSNVDQQSYALAEIPGAIFYADGVLISYGKEPHCCCEFSCPCDALLCCVPESNVKIFVPKDRILSVIGSRQEKCCCCCCPEEDEYLRNLCPCVLPDNMLTIKVDDPGLFGKSQSYHLEQPNGNLVMSGGHTTAEAMFMTKYLLMTGTSTRTHHTPVPMQMVRPSAI